MWSPDGAHRAVDERLDDLFHELQALLCSAQLPRHPADIELEDDLPVVSVAPVEIQVAWVRDLSRVEQCPS